MNIQEQLQHKIDFKTKPLGSLGMLETIALQIGTIQQTLSPTIAEPTILTFAADHGLADEGISPYPKDVTWQMVMNFVAGGAAINVFCKNNLVRLRVVDAGVDYQFPANCGVINAKIAFGTKNMRREPAMTTAQCTKALERGAALVQAEATTGCNTIGFGEMGIGNTSASALLMHAFTGIPIADCTGRGAGLPDKQVQRKAEILKEIAAKYTPGSPIEILATFGGFEMAMMSGAMLEAKKQGMLILIDGFIATAALLAAIAMQPTVRENCIFCHTSNEKGHKLMLNYLLAEPVLNLGLRLGEGTGAALAIPLLRSACDFVNQMASFEQAGVANKA